MSARKLKIRYGAGEGRCVLISLPLKLRTNVFQGELFLYVKTIERTHTPAKMWEKIKLSNNYAKALEQVCNLP